MTKKWSAEEINILKNEFPFSSDKAIADKLGRTPHSIDWKARQLRLYKSRQYLDLWSAEEIGILKKNYPIMSKEELLKLLPKRTWSAIKGKAHFAGVSRYAVSYKNEKVVALPEIEKGYLAGAIDCDGFISLQRRDKRNNFQLWVGVTNTNNALVKKCQEITKIGRIHKATQGHLKPAYTWVVCTFSGTYSLLKQIEPYLVRKRRQAQLGLEFMRIRSKQIRTKNGWTVTKEQLEIYREMRRLNGGND